jgi:lysozyme family protein
MNFPKDFNNFVRGFIYPHENEYEAGHDGDLAYVRTENVPGDYGGLTKFGIDQASHPEVNIAALNPDTAELEYWKDFCASSAIALPGRLALYHFDEVVNAGPGAENHILQNALGLPVDGILGPQTLLAAWTAWENAPATLVSAILDARANHYKAMATAKPNQAQFLDGWLNRVADLRAYQFPN